MVALQASGLQSRRSVPQCSSATSPLHSSHCSTSSCCIAGGSRKRGYGGLILDAKGAGFQPLSIERWRRKAAFRMWGPEGAERRVHSMRSRSQRESYYRVGRERERSEQFRKEGREVDVERTLRTSSEGVSDWKRRGSGAGVYSRGTQKPGAQDQRGELEERGADRRGRYQSYGYERSGRGQERTQERDIDKERFNRSEDAHEEGSSTDTRDSLRDSTESSNGGDSGRSTAGRYREVQEDSNCGVELAAHVDIITSVGNAYVKHLVKVRQSASYRNAAGCVVVVGSVPLREICDVLTRENPRMRKPVKVLLVLEDATPQSDLRSWAERIVFVSEPVMRKVAGVDSTQGLQGVAVLPLPTSFCNMEATGDLTASWVPAPRRVLVLDGIQDPGNLGTLLRTAAAFAWDGVFLLPGCCDPFNEKALRASRGASFRLPIATGLWPQLQSFAKMHAMKLYAADPDEESPDPMSGIELAEHISQKAGTGVTIPDLERVRDLDEVELPSGNTGKQTEAHHVAGNITGKAGSEREDNIARVAEEKALCLVLGSEGQGLSEIALRSCERVSIHMPGDFESLNVAVAGGILLYLLKRRAPLPKLFK